MNVDLTPDAMYRDEQRPSRDKRKKEKRTKANVDQIDTNLIINNQHSSEANSPAHSEKQPKTNFAINQQNNYASALEGLVDPN